MKEEVAKAVKAGQEMGARQLMIALLGAAEKAENNSLDFVEMQYLFQGVLKNIQDAPLISEALKSQP